MKAYQRATQQRYEPPDALDTHGSRTIRIVHHAMRPFGKLALLHSTNRSYLQTQSGRRRYFRIYDRVLAWETHSDGNKTPPFLEQLDASFLV